MARLCFSGSADKSIRAWSVDTGSLVRVFEDCTGSVTSLVLSGDGKTLFSGSEDNGIRAWSVDTGSLVRVFEDSNDSVLCSGLVQRW